MCEVDDVLWQDEMFSLFKCFGVLIVVFVIVVLLVFGGYLWWESSCKSVVGEQGEQLIMVFDKVEGCQFDEGDKVFVVMVGDVGFGLCVVVKLMCGGIVQEQGKVEVVVKFFVEVVVDVDVLQLLWDFVIVCEVVVWFDSLLL